MRGSIFSKFQMLILCSIPIALATGSFLPDLLFSISGIIFIILILKKKLFFYLDDKFVKLFLIWNLYLIVISILSKYPLNSLESSLFYFRFLFGSLAIFYLLQENKLFSQWFLIGIYIIFVVLISDSLLQHFTGYNILNHPKETRLSSIFGEEKKMGSFIIRLLPLFIALNIKHMNTYNISKIFFFYIVVILCFILIFLSLERTAIALLFLMCCLLIFIFMQSFKKTFLTIIFLTLAFALIVINTQNLKNRIINLTYSEINYENKFTVISPQYHAHFVTAYKMFKDNLFFGHGPKMFRYLCYEDEYLTLFLIQNSGCSTHPHNTYLQLLSETGIVGTIPVAFFFIFLTFKFIKLNIYTSSNFIENKNRIYFSLIIIGILLNLFPFTTSGNFFNNWLSVLYFVPIGFFLDYKENIKKDVFNN